MTIESSDEFIRLRTSLDPVEYGRAAREDMLARVWRELLDEHPEMHFWVAHHKGVPIEVLRELAASNDVGVRAMVASKRSLDRALFDRLAEDDDQTVRQRVAVNEKTPRDIRERLARDPEELVRKAVAERPPAES